MASATVSTDSGTSVQDEEWDTAEFQCKDYADPQSSIKANELSEVTRALQDTVLEENDSFKKKSDSNLHCALEGDEEEAETKLNRFNPTKKPAPIDTAAPEVDNPMKAPSQPSTPLPEQPTSEKKRPLMVLTREDETNKSVNVPVGENMADYMTPPTPGVPPPAGEYQDEDEGEDAYSNTFSSRIVDVRNVGPNLLGPREQEIADDVMMQGMNAFFNNKFSKARVIFEARAKDDPLFALGLGSMAFIKAITSNEEKDMMAALETLSETYHFASAQIEAASAQKPFKDTVSHYISNMFGSNPTHMPTNTRPLKKEELRNQSGFMSNGALRAHVIRAECGLLMSIIHLSQETAIGYLRTGINLRRAYTSYSLVWQEYKRMGQDFNKHMDRDTISAIQFGIGAVHLLLSSLPPRTLRIISAFGWKSDKHLGFALLKLCLEGKRVRSPLASLALLYYYAYLTSCAPNVLPRDHIQSAVGVLLDAQQSYPNSAFFLYFAGCMSRLAKNLSLSTQSFTYASEVTLGDWAESTMGQLASFEIAFNHAMEFDWAGAAKRLQELQSKGNHSPAFITYFYGACMEMMGQRTEAILAFAEASELLVKKKKPGQLERYVALRIEFFKVNGYQDLQYSLPALEILLMWNAFVNMNKSALQQCIERIDATLELIYEREKQEYSVRMVELVPRIPIPDYYNQRGALLVTKASILNSLARQKEAIVHLNWVIDHKECFQHAQWVPPFAYWESGVTSWGLQDPKHSRALWETAQTYSGYDFEYRLAIRLNTVLTHVVELGVTSKQAPKPEIGPTTRGRKRLSFVSRFTSSAS